MQIVRAVNSSVRPGMVVGVSRLPRVVLSFLLWVISRTQMSRDLGALGRAEPRMLADMMSAAAPELAAALVAVRP
jgi:2-dehydropantoate 2-reductase